MTDNTHALIHPHASVSFQCVCSCSMNPFPAMCNELVSMFWLKIGFLSSIQYRLF